MTSSLVPEKPIQVSPSLAATIGLEEATMLSILDELASHREPVLREGYHWLRLEENCVARYMPFWTEHDIQRISKSLTDKGVLRLASAPFSHSRVLHFAFNERVEAEREQAPVQPRAHNAITRGASVIPPNWEPSDETLARIAQHNIPAAFAREQIAEFVTFWRESGESQRSWGAKFLQQVLHKWRQHETRMARRSKAVTLPGQWSPGPSIMEQLSNEGIPQAFIANCLTRFCAYHRDAGTTNVSWDMAFYSWAREDWQKQETPFVDTRKRTPMTMAWRPGRHTVEYLLGSYGIETDFINDCVPEFTHKWAEKNGYHSDWGNVFAQHVIVQWRFVQEGIEQNRIPRPIAENWQPSPECVNLLETQSGILRSFIFEQVPEFILYWRGRGEPKYSWNNIFLRRVKHNWAQYKALESTQGQCHEGQQSFSQPRSTRDRSLIEDLTDHSWAY